jgi:hypothetical protein
MNMGEAKRRNDNPAGEKATAGKLSNTFRCGVYTCELTYMPDGGLKAQWSPAMPRAATFSSDDMVAYRRGRTALLAEVSKAIGGGVIVIEA